VIFILYASAVWSIQSEKPCSHLSPMAEEDVDYSTWTETLCHDLMVHGQRLFAVISESLMEDMIDQGRRQRHTSYGPQTQMMSQHRMPMSRGMVTGPPTHLMSQHRMPRSRSMGCALSSIHWLASRISRRCPRPLANAASNHCLLRGWKCRHDLDGRPTED
jgi:hypothetical protein